MKVFKKLSMLFVAAAMMMTTVSTAFAAESKTEKGTIAIHREGASYDVYKVLDAKTKTIGSEDIAVYTINSDFTNFFDGTHGGYTFDADKGIMLGTEVLASADQLLKNDVKNYNQDPKMQLFTQKLYDYIYTMKITPSTLAGVSDDAKGSSIDQGYYLVLENTETITSTSNSGRVPSLAMLINVTKNKEVNIYPKDSELNITKKVENADYNIGELNIPHKFTIDSTVPTYAANYKNIIYKITDTMSDGLTLDKTSINVKVGEIMVIKNGVVVNPTYLKDGGFTSESKVVDGANVTYTTFDFNYDELRKDAQLGVDVKIDYLANINENAVAYNPETNTAELHYTTKPDGTDSGIKDETETYTYALDLLKADGSNHDRLLKDAVFEIKNSDGKLVKEVKSDENGKISFTGLAAGTYTIEEIHAPSTEYALLTGPITIDIQEDSKNKGNCIVSIVNIDEEITTNPVVKDRTISFTIYNYKGINLPETGGMGTTIFMIGGAALIALAGVMLVVYSKKSKKA